jgi:uncharacterized protein
VDYQQMIKQMTPQVYRQLQRAVEVGKWPDGRALTPQQRENALQALIAWGQQHLKPEQRVGYIDKGHKAGDTCDEPAETPLNWKD